MGILVVPAHSQYLYRPQEIDIMTIQEFKEKWIAAENDLNPYSMQRLSELNLSQPSFDFLTSAGLPGEAAPFLSFYAPADELENSIAKLTDHNENIGKEYEHYICIGYTDVGDPIVIDTEQNDQLYLLDHENDLTPVFFNSSILQLAECLIIYRDFVLTIQEENGEEAYLNADFTDEQFEILKSRLQQADAKIFEEDGFWVEQLDMELDEREDFRENG